MLKSKSQIPNPKSQTNPNIQCPKFQTCKFWSLVIWSLCLIWLLVLGYWSLIYLFAEEFTYDAKGKRDPFIHLVTPDGRLLKLEQQEGAEGLTLEGIIYDKHGLSYAIVNGEVVRIGDKVGEYQVLKIENNKVVFLKEGEPTEIELKKEEP